ncbi:zinc carboxypeptidase A 1-like [Cochliomyia hominivorax]
MKVLLLFLIIFNCLLLKGLSEVNLSAARYDDFHVYRVNVTNGQQFSEFKKLGDNLPLRYLNEFKGPGFSYDIVIDPANQDKLEKQLRFLELNFTCTIQDLQSILEEEAQFCNHDHKQTELTWTQYHDLPVIYSWLQKIVANNPHVVKPYIIGRSYEKRPIKAVKISYKPGNKAIFIESNIHAIEWISSAATTCFIDNILKSSDPKIKNLLENYDWIFVPVLNPDGLEYTHHV